MKTTLALLGSVLISPVVFAQANQAGQQMTKSDQLNYLVFGSAAILFFIFVIRSFYVATVTLRENGGEMKFQFPMLRSMTKNPRTLGVIIILMILCALTWVLNAQQ